MHEYYFLFKWNYRLIFENNFLKTKHKIKNYKNAHYSLFLLNNKDLGDEFI